MSDAPIDPARFRQAMGRLAAGVTVLTTFADGHDHAMTADTLETVVGKVNALMAESR